MEKNTIINRLIVKIRMLFRTRLFFYRGEGVVYTLELTGPRQLYLLTIFLFLSTWCVFTTHEYFSSDADRIKINHNIAAENKNLRRENADLNSVVKEQIKLAISSGIPLENIEYSVTRVGEINFEIDCSKSERTPIKCNQIYIREEQSKPKSFGHHAESALDSLYSSFHFTLYGRPPEDIPINTTKFLFLGILTGLGHLIVLMTRNFLFQIWRFWK